MTSKQINNDFAENKTIEIRSHQIGLLWDLLCQKIDISNYREPIYHYQNVENTKYIKIQINDSTSKLLICGSPTVNTPNVVLFLADLYDYYPNFVEKNIIEFSTPHLEEWVKITTENDEFKLHCYRSAGSITIKKDQPAKNVAKVLKEVAKTLELVLLIKNNKLLKDHLQEEKPDNHKGSSKKETSKDELIPVESKIESSKPITTIEKLYERRNDGIDRNLVKKLQPSCFEEIIGQDDAITQIRTNMASPYRQHMIFCGPPGVGKTSVARLCFQEMKNNKIGFKENAPFVEYDCGANSHDWTNRISNLIGYAEDPSYRGVSSDNTIRGVPEIRMGAVCQAHGGILFLDEIGILPEWTRALLLKVLEDGKVMFNITRTECMERKMTEIEQAFFEYGMPANFLLVGATTDKIEMLSKALVSRCMIIEFRSLRTEEMVESLKGMLKRTGLKATPEALQLAAESGTNGRDVNGLLLNGYGFARQESQEEIQINHIIQAKRSQTGYRQLGFRV